MLYQVLFRLTCFDMDEIFLDFDEELLEFVPNSCLEDYKYVQELSKIDFSKHVLNHQLIKKLIEEQLVIAKKDFLKLVLIIKKYFQKKVFLVKMVGKLYLQLKVYDV